MRDFFSNAYTQCVAIHLLAILSDRKSCTTSSIHFVPSYHKGPIGKEVSGEEDNQLKLWTLRSKGVALWVGCWGKQSQEWEASSQNRYLLLLLYGPSSPPLSQTQVQPIQIFLMAWKFILWSYLYISNAIASSSCESEAIRLWTTCFYSYF